MTPCCILICNVPRDLLIYSPSSVNPEDTDKVVNTLALVRR